MDTKGQILHTAIDLFNQYGTAKISTNTIAEKAGISSGNLYYHFEDKAHIIREIYEEMIISWEKPYNREKNQVFSMESLKQFIKENFELLWEYRFFYRETASLLKADPILSERHITITKQRFKQQRNILLQGEKHGIFDFKGPHLQLDEFLSVAWIVSNNFLFYLESMGKKVTYKDYEGGAELILKILNPYIKSEKLNF
jgi:AcrR family transcriptional regulator